MQRRKQSDSYAYRNQESRIEMKDTSLPSHQELEKLRAQVAYIHELEEREKQLTTELADNHEVIWRLRQNPVYLEATAWERLEEVTNKIYKGYTQRLKAALLSSLICNIRLSLSFAGSTMRPNI